MKLNFGALRRVSGVALVAGLFAGCGGDSSNGVTIAGGPQVKTCSAEMVLSSLSDSKVCDLAKVGNMSMPPERPWSFRPSTMIGRWKPFSPAAL